jgi:hypothetical protein
VDRAFRSQPLELLVGGSILPPLTSVTSTFPNRSGAGIETSSSLGALRVLLGSALRRGSPERWGWRRYEFHGLSHAYVARCVPQLAAGQLQGVMVLFRQALRRRSEG